MGYQETLTGENAQKRNIDGAFTIQVPPVAQGSTDFVLVGISQFKGKVANVEFYPKATITGANTNTRLHQIINRKADNSGTAVAASLQYNAGVNAALKVKKVIPVSGTAANVAVNPGDVLEFNSSFVGTGIADTGGVLVVKLTRN